MCAVGTREEQVERAGRLVAVLLWAVAGAALAAWALLAVAHLDDGYLLDHGAGVRMALAQRAADGVLFPPLYEDGVTGGTRYLPLTVLAHAALAGLTGELVASGRLLGYASVLALAGLVVWLLRRSRCPWPVSAVLGASILVAQPGLGAGFGMRADALPAALQLGAVALVTATGGVAGAAGAGLLAALALGSKLTAVWAVAAIALWLVVHDRRRLVLFVGVFAGTALALFGAFQLASEGRMLTQLTGLSAAGVGGVGTFLTAPNRLLRALFLEATPTWALLPLAVAALVLGARRREWTPLHVGLVLQGPLLLAVFADIGVGVNQLIDLTALTAVLAGTAVAARWGERATGWLGLGLALAVTYVVATALVVTVGPDVRAAPAALREPVSHLPTLAQRVDDDVAVLAEDPAVPLLLGRTPVITDPFMLPRLGALEPDALDDLVRRIDSHEFDLVVLILAADGNDDWWARYHLGPEVISAIRRSYRPDGQADGYHLYVPHR